MATGVSENGNVVCWYFFDPGDDDDDIYEAGFIWNRETGVTLLRDIIREHDPAWTDFAEARPTALSADGGAVVGYVDGIDPAGRRFAFRLELPLPDDVITVNDDRDLRDHDPDDGLLDVAPDKEGDQVTLRAAIEYANEKPGRQRIVFDIPGGGIPTIQVGLPPEGENVMQQGNQPHGLLSFFGGSQARIVSCLKATDPVEIDGSTQPGGWVEISGRVERENLKSSESNDTLGVNGLEIESVICIVKVLIINEFYGVGMILTGGAGNRIVGNRIGTDAHGVIGKGNTGFLRYISSRYIRNHNCPVV